MMGSVTGQTTRGRKEEDRWEMGLAAQWRMKSGQPTIGSWTAHWMPSEFSGMEGTVFPALSGGEDGLPSAN